MIFVTVGSSESFDRLVRAVDIWAGLRQRTDVFAQIGRSDYRPQHMQFAELLDPTEYRERVNSAQFIVAHAGMGSIITALELAKPIVVMPRRARYGETRNDHQVGTAERFSQHGQIIVAADENTLPAKLDEAALYQAASLGPPHVSTQLISTIRTFIRESANGKRSRVKSSKMRVLS